MERNFDESLFDLQVDPEAGSHFRESSKWAKFLSVVSFIAIAIVLLFLMFAATTMTRAFQEFRPEFAGAGGFFVAVVLIGMLIVFFTSYLLFRFATLTRQGIERQDQVIFNRGLLALKNYFMIYGVIVMLALMLTIISALTNLGK
jgi:hypothetical protein